MTRSLVFSVLIGSCVLAAVMADCYTGQLREYGREKYCLTREMKPEKVLYGRTLDTQDCYRCTCGFYGLECCGFGIKEGTNAEHVDVPPGCTLVVNGCYYYYMDPRTGYDC